MAGEPTEITLFVMCARCSLVYECVQVRLPERVTGAIDCLACKGPLYSWSGLYDFRFWSPA